MTPIEPLAALHAADPFLALQHALASPWLDPFMAAASISCEGWALALVTVAFVLSTSRERPGRRAVGEIAGYAGALLLAGLVVQVVKFAVPAPRPLAVLGPDAVRVLLEPLRAHSFPSGHSASAAALATLALLRHGRRAWPLLLLALAGGLSRVYVGAHWAVDVVAGWLVGVAAALTVAGAVRSLGRRAAGSLPRATARTP